MKSPIAYAIGLFAMQKKLLNYERWKTTMTNKTERITNIENRIEQLQNQKKTLIQKQRATERKARNHRLFKRAGLLESMLPDTIDLTDEQFEAFLKMTIANDFGRAKLSEIKLQVSNPNICKVETSEGKGS